MRSRLLLEVLVVAALLASGAALIVYTPGEHHHAEPKDVTARRIDVLLNSDLAYDAIVDNYKTGKTIGEVLDEVIKDGEKGGKP